MSSLKDLASLIMIPSLVKDGRLDTVKPLGNSIIHPDATGNNDGTDGSTPAEGNFTFSRGSNLAATRVDVNGLIEKGRENLALYSQDFNNAAWLKSGILVNSNTEANPIDGNVDADTITASAGTTQKYIGVSNSVNGLFTYSFYAKYISQQFVQMFVGADAGFVANFDLQNGNQSASGCTATIVSAGNGWYRCSVFFTSTIGSGVYISPVDSLSSPRFSTTSSTNSFYLFGAQLEKSLVATPYIETGASTAQAGILEALPRLDYSGGASCPSLLLEPQRSNLITQSEYFGSSYWSKSGGSVVSGFTSPEGLSNAYKLVEDTSNGEHFTKTTFSLSANDYSFSIMAKKGERNFIKIQVAGTEVYYNLSNGSVLNEYLAIGEIEPYGNDWYKCIYKVNTTPNFVSIFTSTDGSSVSHQGDGTSGVYIYGAQLETGSYPTSYIPTMGSAVTRSGDSSSLTGASDVLPNSEGVLYFEGNFLDIGSLYSSFTIGNSNNTSLVRFYRANSTTLNASVNNGSGWIWGYSLTTDTTQNFKVALSWSANAFNAFVNGVKLTGATDQNSFTLSQLSKVNMGNESMAFPFYGNSKQVLVFPTALTDSEAIALTTI